MPPPHFYPPPPPLPPFLPGLSRVASEGALGSDRAALGGDRAALGRERAAEAEDCLLCEWAYHGNDSSAFLPGELGEFSSRKIKFTFGERKKIIVPATWD